MTNKTKTILCVCALTASAFAWNATADENDLSGVYYWPEGYNGAWYLYNPNEDIKQTTFHAMGNDAVLSFAIERNNTENGFIFGTYTLDKDGNPVRETLGTVTQKGWVGVTQIKDENGEVIMVGDGDDKTPMVLEKITINTTTSEINDNGEVVESVKVKDHVESASFNAKDVVGVWVQELKENAPFYYSENKVTLDNNTSLTVNPNDTDAQFQYTEGKIVGGDPVGVATLWFDDAISHVSLFDPNPNYGWPSQDAGLDPAFIKIRVQGVASASDGNTSGGPLPGVWATIALAGAASAYLKRRRKENK